MVKHLKKVCKTIISMLIKFVGFDHIKKIYGNVHENMFLWQNKNSVV